MITSPRRTSSSRSLSSLLALALTALVMPGWAAEVADYTGEPIWWEAENAARTNMSTNGYFENLTSEQSARLSGGKLLNGMAKDDTFAEYEMNVPTTGTYEFFLRKWWEHGAFRWHFDNDNWLTIGENQRTFDPINLTGGDPINWQNLGYVKLTAGPHVFRLEMLKDSTYRFSKAYGFDCFVLAKPGFVPQGIRHDGAEHKSAFITIAEADFGKYLPRTLALLESATPTHRTHLKILAYGQSIVANSQAASMLVTHLQEKYPNAVISFKNTAIGGYQAPLLRKTCWQDLYPEYPDLVIFHDYGGEKTGEFEEMYRNLRCFTTAEVLTWTHHVDNFATGVDVERDIAAEFLKEMAKKYEYEIADVRSLWKEQLKRTHESPKEYLLDQIHLNPRGSQLLYDALLPHLRRNEQASNRWQKQVFELALAASERAVAYGATDASLHDGRLITNRDGVVKVTFTGNRLDLTVQPVAGEPGAGASKATLEFILDGKKPTALASSYAVTRPTLAPTAWWPSINQISLGTHVVAQDYRLVFSDISPDGKSYAFKAIGSVSGDEGSGTAKVDFTSRSGAISIKAEDVNLSGVKDVSGKDLPKEFTAAFKVYAMNLDHLAVETTGSETAADAATTVIQCRDDKPHTLEIRTRGGRAGITVIRVYSPSAGNTIDWSNR